MAETMKEIIVGIILKAEASKPHCPEPDADWASEAADAILATRGAVYQVRVHDWMLECFGPEIADDEIERGDRLLEEVFELLQSKGYDPGRIEPLRNYVWARPAGDPFQEAGGVMVCIALALNAYGIDMGAAALTELDRISDPETIAKIRVKQAAKPKMSPLPQ